MMYLCSATRVHFATGQQQLWALQNGKMPYIVDWHQFCTNQ
jgi:hypothetical protein